ncbi:ribonuclease Z [Clostridium acetobutylicum]|nr:Metal-dependent hydrolase of the beta-lactamase superfamily [Clostridium acetobutylicum ATCC 824]AEI33624.1 ribonuclease Z [Clostridium acetobutylicum DSM 1731]AWV81206.1 ribonuclease Z [Clostridium acetobutylicum]PSM04489.1 ribonuclease Z [Clostridium sp. NJ4]TQD47559.1 ribonuclease Z [Clostridium acetobutylicum]
MLINMLDICLLGCGGSLPTSDRNLTSLLISYNGRKILIDCGEGTQVSMKEIAWGFKDIDVICFTHYHADHVMGLTGLLLTIANSGRIDPLTIIGPEGLREVVKGLTVVAPFFPYEIELIELDSKCSDNFLDKVFKIEDVEIFALPVDHSIECLSYSVRVNRKRKFDVNKAKANEVPLKIWNELQRGKEITYENKLYVPDMVLGESRKGIKITYCTDTRPVDSLHKFAYKSDLFVCEGMYGEEEKKEKAVDKKHMIFSEAAGIAKAAEVKELWLTHFSPALSEPEKYLENAKEIFENTHIGSDRKIKIINFENN